MNSSRKDKEISGSEGFDTTFRCFFFALSPTPGRTFLSVLQLDLSKNRLAYYKGS